LGVKCNKVAKGRSYFKAFGTRSFCDVSKGISSREQKILDFKSLIQNVHIPEQSTTNKCL